MDHPEHHDLLIYQDRSTNLERPFVLYNQPISSVFHHVPIFQASKEIKISRALSSYGDIIGARTYVLNIPMVLFLMVMLSLGSIKVIAQNVTQFDRSLPNALLATGTTTTTQTSVIFFNWYGIIIICFLLLLGLFFYLKKRKENWVRKKGQ